MKLEKFSEKYLKILSKNQIGRKISRKFRENID